MLRKTLAALLAVGGLSSFSAVAAPVTDSAGYVIDITSTGTTTLARSQDRAGNFLTINLSSAGVFTMGVSNVYTSHGGMRYQIQLAGANCTVDPASFKVSGCTAVGTFVSNPGGAGMAGYSVRADFDASGIGTFNLTPLTGGGSGSVLRSSLLDLILALY